MQFTRATIAGTRGESRFGYDYHPVEITREIAGEKKRYGISVALFKMFPVYTPGEGMKTVAMSS